MCLVAFEKAHAQLSEDRVVVPKMSLNEFNAVLSGVEKQRLLGWCVCLSSLVASNLFCLDYSRSGLAPKALSELNQRYLYTWTGGNPGELKTFSNFF